MRFRQRSGARARIAEFLGHGLSPTGVDILRPRAALASALLTFSLLTAAVVSAPIVSAATVAATTTCSNSVDNTPGLGAICEIEILNTITTTGGSAVVTARECHGAAGDPEASCTGGTPLALTEPVTIVNQCNGAMNGGGGTLRCSVHVTNTYVDVAPTVANVTVNQCVGSGGGITTGCDPFPATTSGADITQCNGSANGGTLVELTCTATGQGSGFVTINQCNGSTNGGGALVICSANVDTLFQAPASAAPSANASSGHTPSDTATSRRLTQPPTDSVSAGASSTSSTPWLVLAIVALAALAVGTATRTRARRR